MAREVVEICAGAGGQALGLELAGFHHRLAVELDDNAADTLEFNRPGWEVRRGDVADPEVWDPSSYKRIDLLAGGVPCPPFSVAGKQLGASDERDLFAWGVELAGQVEPKALLLENVRGLSQPRFSGYRQQVKERLAELGYWSDWKLLEARDFGVPQLRPRFILIALQHEFAPYFEWPAGGVRPQTVGDLLVDLMGANGWKHADDWASRANSIAPTIVGGSKKHGGADLGPTRAKAAWLKLGVDGKGVADAAPDRGTPKGYNPRLTTEMVARIQGWLPTPEYDWTFTGRKTTQYRQIGNAFPPPVARAVGSSIMAALEKSGNQVDRSDFASGATRVHDPVLRKLRATGDWVEVRALASEWASVDTKRDLASHLSLLERDFYIDHEGQGDAARVRLGGFKAFTGQQDHLRHEAFRTARSKIS
jgi:DNA (cytosine-5)-methyltransferase 1